MGKIGLLVSCSLVLLLFLAGQATGATLTADVSGMAGYDRVVSDPPGIDCFSSSGTCTANFATGSYVALAAVPVDGTTWTSSFLNWSGSCSGASEACVLLMNSNKNVSANFGALGIPVGIVTVTVTLNGGGTIVSNPEGISCSGNVCTGEFQSSTAVALQAVPETPPAGYSASFVGWSGDCTGDGPCPLYLDTNKDVTAQFSILGPPIFALPAPVGQSMFRYNPVSEPALGSRPMAIGDIQDAVALRMGVPPYAEPVDIYVGIEVPGLDDLLLVRPGNTASVLSDGLIAWKEDALYESVDEPIFGEIDISTIPEGLYRLYVMVTPAGSLASYSLWVTYFDTTSPMNAFLP